ncbi:MAG: lytic transglycosylase domain-containing protein, partial [Magnetovibrio sp.]|nr:lytic transglycosylase domain-containing protein [Magnetovibrio sp.]
ERAGMPLGALGYPKITPPKPKTGDMVETPLVLAVIRQESAFYSSAKSHAGARGLMQVMPATAKRVAKANRLPYSRDKLLNDPDYNLIIGQVYLASMIKRFDGSYPMALAAYNAGPHRVRRWVKTFGDPRDDQTDLIDWVEMIPYTETRIMFSGCWKTSTFTEPIPVLNGLLKPQPLKPNHKKTAALMPPFVIQFEKPISCRKPFWAEPGTEPGPFWRPRWPCLVPWVRLAHRF